MQKTTIFFIGTTVIVLMITGTVLGVNFSIRHSNENIDDEVKTVIENSDVAENTSEVNENETIEISNEITENNGETDNAIVIPTSIETASPSITLSQVQEAGFKNATFPITPFDGMVFDIIDMKQYVNKGNLEYQIVENGENAAFLTEFNLLTPEIAQEVYEILRKKVQEKNQFTINETNQYGSASFFANNSEQTNHVFLVVKQGNRLYTCHYPAKNHNKIKNLIISI